MNVNSIIVLIMGIVLVALVGFVFVSYLSEKKSRETQKPRETEAKKTDEEIKPEHTESFVDSDFIIPEEINDERNNDENIKREILKTDKKTIFTEKKSILVPNEKWTVSVSRAENKDAVFNTFYIFTHNFIYGDKKLYIGTQMKKSIVLRDGGVAKKHGVIFYDQDFGLVYKDLIGGKLAYYKRAGYKSKNIYNTCVEAPYTDKENALTVDMIKITDGLELFIGVNVLKFVKSDVMGVSEQRKELKEESSEMGDDDIKKIIAEADLKNIVNKSKKGIRSWIKNNF